MRERPGKAGELRRCRLETGPQPFTVPRSRDILRTGGQIAASLFAASCSQGKHSAPAEPVRAPVFANVKLIAEPRFPTPDSFAAGQLLTRGPCLILRTSYGKEYSPVLPFGSRFVMNSQAKVSIVILGTTLKEGQSTTFKGGTGQYGRSTPGPPTCPRLQFVVGHIISPEQIKAMTRQQELLNPAPPRLLAR